MTRRKRSPLRVLLGLALIVAGFVGVAIGIVAVIGERDRIDDEAVAQGELPARLEFTAEQREYRVFVISSDAETDSTRTACRTSTGADFGGSRQGVSVTLGSASSVGTFDGAGTMTIACDGPEGVRFIVTPTGGSLLRGVLTIVGGALVGVLGLLLVIWGLVGRRVPA
jgi:hypothetical protein